MKFMITMKNKTIIVILFYFGLFVQNINSQSCKNFREESLENIGNPDTIFTISGYTGNFTFQDKWKSKVDEKDGRLVVYVFKKENIWYSSISVITRKKSKFVWYQSYPDRIVFYNYEEVLPQLFDSVWDDIESINIELNERLLSGWYQHSGKYIKLYIKKGDDEINIPFYQPPIVGDQKDLFMSKYHSIFLLYSIGLSNSYSLYMPIEGKCK